MRLSDSPANYYRSANTSRAMTRDTYTNEQVTKPSGERCCALSFACGRQNTHMLALVNLLAFVLRAVGRHQHSHESLLATVACVALQQLRRTV